MVVLRMRVSGVPPGTYKLGVILELIKWLEDAVSVPSPKKHHSGGRRRGQSSIGVPGPSNSQDFSESQGLSVEKRCSRHGRPWMTYYRRATPVYDVKPCNSCHSHRVLNLGGAGVCSVCGHIMWWGRGD